MALHARKMCALVEDCESEKQRYCFEQRCTSQKKSENGRPVYSEMHFKQISKCRFQKKTCLSAMLFV